LQGQEDFIMGAEGAGVVLACGPDISSLEPGQAVACNSASFAEHAIVSARMCHAVPKASAEAAAMVLSGVFACGVITVTGGVTQGTNVLITAGAGVFVWQSCH
jgi:NADPH:quinone reductase